jgi:hypothetical protein
MEKGPVKPEEATWWDHHELTFWLWAFMRNADAYLGTSQATQDAYRQIFEHEMSRWPELRERARSLQNETTLLAYHFITTMGVLVRVLKRAQHLFPIIQPPYSRANHLMKEGKELRDMIEHAYGKDGYLAGGGRHKDKFVHQEEGIAADATSTIIKNDGHWLGNRLCVEKVVQEVKAIKDIADTIDPPQPVRD